MVAQIFENEDEIKYRFCLEPEEEKKVIQSNEKLEIKMYKYTDAKV